MSLVIGFISPDFLMLCGEERIRMGEDIFCENFRKVYYFNENVVFGFVGNVNNNSRFIQEFLQDFNLLFDNQFKVDYEKTKNISFEELDIILTERHSAWKKEAQNSGVFPDSRIVIGGYINGRGVLKSYSVLKDNSDILETWEEENALGYQILGNVSDQEALYEAMNLISPSSINNLRQVFQETITNSSVKNNGINKNMDAVFLRRYANLKNEAEKKIADGSLGEVLIGKIPWDKEPKKPLEVNDKKIDTSKAYG